MFTFLGLDGRHQPLDALQVEIVRPSYKELSG
jgi:hypothetical protein